MEQFNSFYIIATNTNSPGSSRFLTYLHRCLNLPPNKYEVAITDFDYNLKKPTEFSAEDATVLIKTGSVVAVGLNVSKVLGKSIADFLTQCNINFLEENFAVEVGMEMVEGVQHVLISINKSNNYLILPENLALALGFNTPRLEEGENIAPNLFNQTLFNQVPDGDILFQLIQNMNTQSISFLPENSTQPENTSDIVAKFVQSLVTNTLASTIVVSINWVTKELKFSRGNENLNYSVQFSSRVNNIFGLAPDFIFTSNTVLTLPEWNIHDRRIDIFLDGLKPTVIDTHLVPLLGSFYSNREYNKQQTKSFYPRYYIELDKTRFDYLKFHILNEFSNEVSFNSEPLRVKLHFRRKSNEKGFM
jgi:hypothetical protein